MLVLIAASILNDTATVNKSTEDKGAGASVVLKVVLGYSLRQNHNAMPIYAMFDVDYLFRPL